MELGIPKIDDNAIKVIPRSQKNLVNTHTEEEWQVLEASSHPAINARERTPKLPFGRGPDDRPICVVGGLLFACLLSFSTSPPSPLLFVDPVPSDCH